MAEDDDQYGPADVTCPYCGEEFHVETGPTKLTEVTHCNDRWIVVDLEAEKAGHTNKYATDGGSNDKQRVILTTRFKAIVEVPIEVLEDDSVDPDDYLDEGELLEHAPMYPWKLEDGGDDG